MHMHAAPIPCVTTISTTPRPILFLGGQHSRHLIDDGLRVFRCHEATTTRVFRIPEAPGPQHELLVVVLVEGDGMDLLVHPHAVVAGELLMAKAEGMRTKEGGGVGKG